MELIFKQEMKPQVIEFNFYELKAEIAEAVKQYTNIAYTDDQMQEAKADRAKLRKFSDVLDNARKQVKKDCLAPYTVFESQIKELISLINEPVILIDKQVKEYEEKLRYDKEKVIIDYWKTTEHPEDMFLSKIWTDRWLNATYAMKKIEEEIAAGIEKWNTEMAVIERLNNPVPARMVYVDTMDLARAIAASDKQDEIERQKAAEAARKAEEAKLPDQEATASVPADQKEQKEPERVWLTFKAYLTPQEAAKLRKFFELYEIQFVPVK